MRELIMMESTASPSSSMSPNNGDKSTPVFSLFLPFSVTVTIHARGGRVRNNGVSGGDDARCVGVGASVSAAVLVLLLCLSLSLTGLLPFDRSMTIAEFGNVASSAALDGRHGLNNYDRRRQQPWHDQYHPLSTGGRSKRVHQLVGGIGGTVAGSGAYSAASSFSSSTDSCHGGRDVQIGGAAALTKAEDKEDGDDEWWWWVPVVARPLAVEIGIAVLFQALGVPLLSKVAGGAGLLRRARWSASASSAFARRTPFAAASSGQKLSRIRSAISSAMSTAGRGGVRATSTASSTARSLLSSASTGTRRWSRSAGRFGSRTLKSAATAYRKSPASKIATKTRKFVRLLLEGHYPSSPASSSDDDDEDEIEMDDDYNKKSATTREPTFEME